MGDTDGGGEFMRVGMGLGSDSTSSSSQAPIDSSNIGFQLLKKHGWKEGTGLGISEQGRLEPVEAFLNKNKRGLGAEKMQKPQRSENAQLLGANRKNDKDHNQPIKPRHAETSSQGGKKQQKSYAQVLKGVENQFLPGKKQCIQIQPVGHGWLARSAVAKIRRLLSTEDLERVFKLQDIHNVKVKAIGGRCHLERKRRPSLRG